MDIRLVIGLAVALIVIAVVLVVVGLRSPEGADPLQTRLAAYSTRERPLTLEEIELSQPLSERIFLPVLRKAGQFATRFTPQASLQDIQHKLDLAGNPKGWEPTLFFAGRIGAGLALGGVLLLLSFISQSDMLKFSANPLRALGIIVAGGVFGFYIPNLLLQSKITRRQESIIKSMPDALDLLTVCVEAGQGFDQAMQQTAEKWENELSLAFERVIQEIRLGKLRREALRDMAERMDIADMTSFVAALIQADQLGVSMAKVLRIQSDQMRIKRRQRAEKKAHEAPIKMLIPMAFLIFPSIYIVLLGPAALSLINSPALQSVFGGG